MAKKVKKFSKTQPFKSQGKTKTYRDKRKKTVKGNTERKGNKTISKKSESDFEEVLNTYGTGVEDVQIKHDEEDVEFEEECKTTRELIQKQNRKNKKSGGFQSMGLSFAVFKGVMKKGYKVPTPIQRKTVPLIMDGKDVVAMARTGSGKTAAFLIPMFERLKAHSAKSGARALILSPTRELAIQTLKFTKELGKYTGLRAAVILGGDSMEDQFAAMHENPDIVIATPGRFMHVLVEMELKLSVVEYIVFDEADRLFEMGFREQLHEILDRLPESKQTVLFSATLPKLLVDFAKAGLHDPTLVRLDTDTKLSENLKLAFLQCKTDSKLAVLLYLMKNIVQPSEQTVIFVATKHHVEYLYMLLSEAGITCSYSYSSLDQTARKINVAKFQNKKTMVLIVTDLAARGIDIPMLDIVINYNFPAKPKLFVHRVGRVARAGRSGTAYSLISPDELAYVMDLHLFLGRPLKIVNDKNTNKDDNGLCGSVPQNIIDEAEDTLRTLNLKSEMVAMKRVINNAYKQYVRTRPSPSAESFKRVKSILEGISVQHPLFGEADDKITQEKTKMIGDMRNYRPNTTVFEMNSNRNSQSYGVMKAKRAKHNKAIESRKLSLENRAEEVDEVTPNIYSMDGVDVYADDETVKGIFSRVIAPKRMSEVESVPPKKKKSRLQVKDDEFYLSYKPKDFYAEKGLNLGSTFDKAAKGVMLDIAGDDEQKHRIMNNQLKWDRKKKKYIRDANSDPSNKKIQTESGSWISASYKSNIYKEWLEKSKMEEHDSDSEGGVKNNKNVGKLRVLGHGQRRNKVMKRQSNGESGPELKRKEQILKKRKRDAQKRNSQKFNERKRTQRKKKNK